MQKYAYQSPDEFRPNTNTNFREAAAKPYMGLTAFLRSNDPWLVIGFDGKNHILESRDGNIVKLNTPFTWTSATDKSRLVAAIRSEGSSIPGTPHYSFEDGEWYLRIEDSIYDVEDFLEEIEKTAQIEPSDPYDLYDLRRSDISTEELLHALDFYNLEDTPENREKVIQEMLDPFSDFNKIEPDTCEVCKTQDNPSMGGTFTCKNCGHTWPVDIAHDHPEDDLLPFTSHQTQKGDDRKDERQSGPAKCPNCKSHTRGNRMVQLDEDGNPVFHCKSCGTKWTQEDTIINPKLTYQVDKDKRAEGEPSPYAPGPDDPNKVCPGCGYSWKENHKFQVGDRSCPECGHEVERQDKYQNVGAPGKSWKNKKRGFTYDTMSGKDTNWVNDTEGPQEGRNTDIVETAGNVTPNAAPLPVANNSQIDISTLPPELQQAIQQHMQTAASIKESSWKEDHNYKHAEGKKKCSNCEYFHGGHCSMFDAEVEEDYVCDEWESGKHESHIKIARRAFTPAEQKSLIEENMGSLARNHSKLNLEGTHYISRTRDEDPELWLW